MSRRSCLRLSHDREPNSYLCSLIRCGSDHEDAAEQPGSLLNAEQPKPAAGLAYLAEIKPGAWIFDFQLQDPCIEGQSDENGGLGACCTALRSASMDGVAEIVEMSMSGRRHSGEAATHILCV